MQTRRQYVGQRVGDRYFLRRRPPQHRACAGAPVTTRTAVRGAGKGGPHLAALCSAGRHGQRRRRGERMGRRRAGSHLPCRAASRSPSPAAARNRRSVARDRAAARGRLSCPARQHAVVERVDVNPILVHRVVPRIERDHRRSSALVADFVTVESPGKTRKICRVLGPGCVVGAPFRTRARPPAAEARRRLAGRAAPADCPGAGHHWRLEAELGGHRSKSMTVEMRHVSHLRVAVVERRELSRRLQPVCPRGDRAGAGRAAGRRQTGAGSPRTDPVCVPTVDRQDECFGSEDAPGFPAVPSVCPARWSRQSRPLPKWCARMRSSGSQRLSASTTS